MGLFKKKQKQEEVSQSTEELISEEIEQVKNKPATLQDSLEEMSERAGATVKRERFEWVRMWISYLVSMTMKDRGKIPDNIGDKILITNNLYITKLYMSTIIHIHELGVNTPETLLEVLNKELRNRGNRCILDMTIKNQKFYYDKKDSGLQTRIRSWTRSVENPDVSRKGKERAARCLYTVSVAESGKQLKLSRMYLTIRAKDIQTLNSGEKIVTDALTQMECTYLPAYSNVKDTLEYISILGNYNGTPKETVAVMTSNLILSQILPNCGSFNDRKGIYMGQNIQNGTPYFLDVDSINVARNIYCAAPSGTGKTVIAINMAQSAYENGSNVCFMDIKGNEFTNFINATNGYIVSCRPDSTEYINSWIMRAENTDREHAEVYFKSRIGFSKQQMIILSGLRDRQQLLEFEELLDEFHDALYTSIGASAYNINSWKETEKLNPYVVFEKFKNYMTPEKRSQYGFNKSVIGTLRMYMSESGSKSYLFKREFDYASILKARTLSFDFGILANQTAADVDLDLFRLKFLYMSKLNGDFVTRNYANGIRTFKVLEESQVVSDEIMRMYVEEYTLRRSQKQDTLLLGNSVQALKSSIIAQPLIENTRGILIGDLETSARETLMEEFGLQHLRNLIRLPGSDRKYQNSFVFVNKMQSKEQYPIIKAVMNPKLEAENRKYKVLIPTAVDNVMAGDTKN